MPMTTSLRVALVTPLTGPDAAHGIAALRAAKLWARDERLPRPWDDVSVTAYDAYPEPVSAMSAALATRPAAVFGPYGQKAALAVCRATDRVVFNCGAPSTRFVRQAFPNVINVVPATSTWTRPALAAIRTADRRVRKVVMLVADSDTAAELTSVTKVVASTLDFELTSTVFQPGKAAAAAGRLPPADVLLVHGEADDEVAVAGVLLRRPWRAAALSTAARGDTAASLGNLREGLLAPRLWAPESTAEVGTGVSAQEFTAAYTNLHGSSPNTSAAWTYAAGLIFGRCVRYCGGTEDLSVLAAARGLETTTLLGRFRLDEATGLQVGQAIPIVQWQAGTARIVWPRDVARAPLTYPRQRADLVAVPSFPVSRPL
jgi:ABC-type branched-subunit amino acid transport system substrate-binding protein